MLALEAVIVGVLEAVVVVVVVMGAVVLERRKRCGDGGG